jgi:D-3-phosphoglycerate dehydrogenase
MKIYLIASTARPTKDQVKKLESLGKFFIIDAQKFSPFQVIEKAPDAEILIAGTSGVQTINKELLSGLKQLQYISLLTVAVDWVDLNAARELQIPISNIKGANSESVAEHTWGMILSLAKRITEFDRDVRSKGAYKFGDYRGKEVYGKTIGIIGLGDIGKRVARIAKGFNMNILGINESGKPVDGVQLTTLDTLLKQSDVITICVPLTPKTDNMLSDKEFTSLKDGAILINCARPEIVNKKDVLNALNKGKLFGYGIETEIMKSVSPDDEYLEHPRIIITPHNAFNTEDAEIKSFDAVIENIEGFLSGKPIRIVT